jgi:hypothetical protein
VIIRSSQVPKRIPSVLQGKENKRYRILLRWFRTTSCYAGSKHLKTRGCSVRTFGKTIRIILPNRVVMHVTTGHPDYFGIKNRRIKRTNIVTLNSEERLVGGNSLPGSFLKQSCPISNLSDTT